MLKNSPLYARAQQHLDGATSAQPSRARAGELRKRLLTSRIIQQGGLERSGNANGEAQDDDAEADLERPHEDTWTEVSSAPETPRSDTGIHIDSVFAPFPPSDLDQQALDPDESPLFSYVAAAEELNNEAGRHSLFKWLQKCSSSMVQGMGTLCLAPLKGVVGLAQQCATVLQDVVNWCYRGLLEIHRRGMMLLM